VHVQHKVRKESQENKSLYTCPSTTC